MKKYFSLLIFLAIIAFNSCINGQAKSNYNLSATEFADLINKKPDCSIVDVRTAEEFQGGHLQNAFNSDWNGSEFLNQISKLDKAKPVLVYCLSGGRSSAAANKMREEGYEVYELQGGLMKWRAANLPESSSDANSKQGLSMKQFNHLLNPDKIVLIDFYADWCIPCKKMKPYLEEIATDMVAKVNVIRINVDDNKQLCKEMNIDALPVLHLYKSKALTWSNTGYVEKDEVLKKIFAE